MTNQRTLITSDVAMQPIEIHRENIMCSKIMNSTFNLKYCTV